MEAGAESNPAESAPLSSVAGGETSDRILTADEVAALLRVTKGWLYAETRAGRVPHLRLGRYVRYRRSAIERWLDGLEQGSLRPLVGAGRPAPPPVSALSRRR